MKAQKTDLPGSVGFREIKTPYSPGNAPGSVVSISRIIAAFLLVLMIILPCENSISVESNRKAFKTEFNGATYEVFCLYPPYRGLRFLWKDESGSRFGSIRNVVGYFVKEKRKVVFAMNGGIFDESFVPLGLHRENCETKVDLNLKTGRGNFYLKPNGILMISGSGAKIIKTENYTPDNDVLYAVQSGPMLVINNAINPVFKPGSTNKYIRNGAGVSADGALYLVISDEVVNMYDFADVFRKKLGCENALYLDGYVSRMYLPELKRFQDDGDFGSIIVVVE